jgi:hypothetical protein
MGSRGRGATANSWWWRELLVVLLVEARSVTVKELTMYVVDLANSNDDKTVTNTNAFRATAVAERRLVVVR